MKTPSKHGFFFALALCASASIAACSSNGDTSNDTAS